MMGMGQPMMNQPAAKVTFTCPKCGRELAYDKKRMKSYSGSGDFIICDLCDKETKKVLSCNKCDYDICMKCCKERS